MSHDSVTRILKGAGFRSMLPVHKPLLSAVNKKKRLKFAKSLLNYTKWHKVIFSDEKIFTVRPGIHPSMYPVYLYVAGGHVRAWIPKTKDKYSAKYTIGTVSHPQKIMVWAAMDAGGRICLRRCPDKVNASEYQKILQSAMSFIRRRY